MEVPIKFDLHQEVHVILENRAAKFAVRELRIFCKYRGSGGFKNWGDTDGHGYGWPWEIEYLLDDGKTWVNQKRLFATKEELLNSL